MRDVVVSVLLAATVAATWLGAIGFLRLKSALDRLHCVAFVNVAAGVPFVLAAFVADGFSTRACKILAMLVITVVAGAAVNQAIGRAVLTRGGEGGEPP